MKPNVNVYIYNVYKVFLYVASGGFSDSDLENVSKDNTYKPDKGKGKRCNLWVRLHKSKKTKQKKPLIFLFIGEHPRGDNDRINQYDDNNGEWVLVSVSLPFLHLLHFLTKCIFQRRRLRWAPSRGLSVPSPWRWWEQSAATSPTRRRSCVLVYNVRVLIFNPLLSSVCCRSGQIRCFSGCIQAWFSVQCPMYTFTWGPHVPY